MYKNNLNGAVYDYPVIFIVSDTETAMYGFKTLRDVSSCRQGEAL